MRIVGRNGKSGQLLRVSRVACWGLLFAIGSLPLSAQGSRSLGPLGQALTPIEGEGKHYEANVLTIKQLTKCVALRRDVPEVEQQLLSLRERVESSSTVLDELIQQLETLKPFLEAHKDDDFTSQEQVDDFNLQVDKFNGLNRQYSKQVEKYNVLEAAYNGLVNEHAMLVSIHQESCEARQYYREDMLSVLASLGEVQPKGTPW